MANPDGTTECDQDVLKATADCPGHGTDSIAGQYKYIA